MLSFKLKINESGFTIMEMMVTVAIIMIMTVVYLTDYRQTNQKIILDQAVAGVVADLRYAQNMAMNVKLFNGEIPQGGYGVNISSIPSTSYTIFADCDDSHTYDGASLKCVSNTIAEKVRDQALPTHISISSSDFNNITFQPPNPIVWINGITPVASSIITLQYGTSGPIKKITINGYTGQMSVSN